MENVDLSSLVVTIEAASFASTIRHNDRFKLDRSAERRHSPGRLPPREARDETPAVEPSFAIFCITLADGHLPFDPVNGWTFGSDEESCDIVLSTNLKSGLSRRHFCISLDAQDLTVRLTCLSRNGLILKSENLGDCVMKSTTSQGLREQTNVYAGDGKVTIFLPHRSGDLEREFNWKARQFLTTAQMATPQLAGLRVTEEITPKVRSHLTPPTRGKPAGTNRRAAYSFKDIIGRGAFGSVWEVVETKSGRTLAGKVLPAASEVRRKEIEVMKKISHEHIVEFYDEFRDDQGRNVVIMELLKHDLRRLIPLEFSTAFNMTRQMLDALTYLHAKAITHRDIKPENILVAFDGCFKLADFGLSKDQDVSASFSVCGSSLYLAPEIGRCEYTVAVDLWSLGVVLLESHWRLPSTRTGLRGRDLRPWAVSDDWTQALSRKAGKCQQPPTALSRILCTMLEIEPVRRTTASSLLGKCSDMPADRFDDSTRRLFVELHRSNGTSRCPVPDCVWASPDRRAMREHLMGSHRYERVVSDEEPLVYLRRRSELINARNLLNVAGLGRRAISARLESLRLAGVKGEEKEGRSRGVYITFDDAVALCIELGLDPLPLDLIRAEPTGDTDDAGDAGDAGEVTAVHGQLFIKQLLRQTKPAAPRCLSLINRAAAPLPGTRRGRDDVADDAAGRLKRRDDGRHLDGAVESTQWEAIV